jgi:hypothetical protein
VTSRRLPALLLFAAGAVLLAGCGDAASGTSASGATTTTQDAFRSCLARHGVDLPDFGRRGQPPGGGAPPGSSISEGGGAGQGGAGQFARRLPKGVDQQDLQQAMDACRSLRPAGGFGGGRGGGFDSQAFAAYRSCMQDHGVTLPTGGFGRGARGGAAGGSTTSVPTSVPSSPPTSIDRTSPAYQAADQACAALRPTPPGSTTTTTPRT